MSEPATQRTEVERADLRMRMRLLGVLFASSAMARTGFIAVFTVTALAAEDILGSARWSGVAAATGTFGLAAGMTPVAAFMARRGRRPGLVVSLATVVVGAAVASYAVRIASFPILLVGMTLIGLGNSGDRLGRYAAADIAPERLRSSAIAAVVWAGTIGSVIGPLLLPVGASIMEPRGFTEYGGGYLIAGVLAIGAAVMVYLFLRPDPLELAGVTDGASTEAPSRAPLGDALRLPLVRYALASLIVGQGTMVVIMSMTPVHIRRAGESITLVGLVIGVHTFGMFFFSPISGYLADRFGKIRVIVIGQGLLIASALIAAPANGDDRMLLLPALFLLGLGWNFGFVAGSSLISDAAEGKTRVRLQGVVDTTVFATAAVAAIVSGVILESIDYVGLSLVGGAVVFVPLYLRYRYRGELGPVATQP